MPSLTKNDEFEDIKMTKNANALDWIDRNDAEQIAWVNQYLSKYLRPCSLWFLPTSEMAILNNHIPVPIDADLILFINKMRLAWRQKKFRSKQNGKKTYSFVMSTEVEKKLKVLAGHKGKIRQTLEALIVQRYESEVPNINELKNKNNELKNKNNELQAKVKEKTTDNLTIKEVNHALNQASIDKDEELSKLKTELKQLKQDKANLLNELKQLKEKHNNQFRTGDKKTSEVIGDKTADTKEENE